MGDGRREKRKWKRGEKRRGEKVGEGRRRIGERNRMYRGETVVEGSKGIETRREENYERPRTGGRKGQK